MHFFAEADRILSCNLFIYNFFLIIAFQLKEFSLLGPNSLRCLNPKDFAILMQQCACCVNTLSLANVDNRKNKHNDRFCDTYWLCSRMTHWYADIHKVMNHYSVYVFSAAINLMALNYSLSWHSAMWQSSITTTIASLCLSFYSLRAESLLNNSEQQQTTFVQNSVAEEF